MKEVAMEVALAICLAQIFLRIGNFELLEFWANLWHVLKDFILRVFHFLDLLV